MQLEETGICNIMWPDSMPFIWSKLHSVLQAGLNKARKLFVEYNPDLQIVKRIWKKKKKETEKPEKLLEESHVTKCTDSTSVTEHWCLTPLHIQT